MPHCEIRHSFAVTSERDRERERREWNIHEGGENKRQRFLSAVYVNIPRSIHQTAKLPFLAGASLSSDRR